MISNNPAASSTQETPRRDATAGSAESPVLDPRATIEAASGGTGSTTDPGATDNKPPGVADYERFL